MMKSAICLLLLAALAGMAVAQAPAEATPLNTTAVNATGVNATTANTTAAATPEANTTAAANATGGATAPAAGGAAAGGAAAGGDEADGAAAEGNGTFPGALPLPANHNPAIVAYYATPADVTRNLPQLQQLNGLLQHSALTKNLTDKSYKATIFAPNNQAVTAALQFVQTHLNLTASDLAADSTVLDQILSYHITQGAALPTTRFVNGTNLTMADNEKTTIIVVPNNASAAGASARKLLQNVNVSAASATAANASYRILNDANPQQTWEVVQPNIQGGSSIIHVINGVLIPRSLLQAANISANSLPGANGSSGSSVPPGADGANPRGSGSGGSQGKASNGAAKAVAAMLSVPALLAVLLL
jgi:uncharacterized surface protein with fasciclin (FAS1) repeats